MSLPIPHIPFNNTLHPYYLAFSAASVLASTFVVVSYVKLRKRIQHPSGVQLWRSIFDIVFAGSIIALFFLNPDDQETNCDVLGPIFQFTLLGSQCWYFVLSFDLLFSLFNPFSDLGSNVKFYHLFVWVVSGASVVIIALYGDFDYRPAFQLCWIQVASGGSTPNFLSWGTFFAPTIFFLVFGITVTIVAWVRIRHGINETLKLRERVLWNCTITNFVFTINWAAAGVLYIILYTEEIGTETESPRLFGAFAAIIGGLGLTDAIVWILTQGLPCKMCRPNDEAELLKPINYALRREIIYNTAQGICENLDRVIDYKVLNSPPPRDSKYYPTKMRPSKNSHATYTFKVKNQFGKAIPFNDYAPRVFRLIRHMIGITDEEYLNSFEVTLRADKHTMKERYTEGKSGSFFYFTPDGKYLVKTMTQGEVATLLTMLPDYTKHVYKYRNTFLCKYVGLHYVRMYGEEVFFVVMQSVFVTDLVVHERYDIKGSTYGRYSKNLTLDKSGHIQEVLKDLDIHKRFMISQERKRLLMEQMNQDVRFLTRQNIMDYSMLVGVRYVRQYRSVPGTETPLAVGGDRYDSDDNIELVREQSSINNSLELKDSRKDDETNNFKELNSKLIELKQPLLDENEEDHVGVPPELLRLLSPENPDERKMEFFHNHNGGVKAEVIDGPGVYYFGIIDILQYYNIRKKLEHFLKSYIICQPRKKISCVHPKFYGKRFISKIDDVTQTHTGELADDVDHETPMTQKRSSDVRLHVVGSVETGDM